VAKAEGYAHSRLIFRWDTWPKIGNRILDSSVYHQTPMPKRCKECGSVARDDARHCESCGKNSWETGTTGFLEIFKTMSLVVVVILVVFVIVWVFWGR